MVSYMDSAFEQNSSADASKKSYRSEERSFEKSHIFGEHYTMLGYQ